MAYIYSGAVLELLLFCPSENKPKKELISMLQQMGYDSDPVKAWKSAQKVGPLPLFSTWDRNQTPSTSS